MIINQVGGGGGTLPTLTNPGQASELLNGKQLIGQDGNIVTGTLATVSQATPGISVSSSGLITATSTQASGNVVGGTKSATHQLPTSGGLTFKPEANQQVFDVTGKYMTGPMYCNGDVNLQPGNIRQGVSIFGVQGAMQQSNIKMVWGSNPADNVVRITRKNDRNITATFFTIPYIQKLYACFLYIYELGSTAEAFVSDLFVTVYPSYGSSPGIMSNQLEWSSSGYYACNNPCVWRQYGSFSGNSISLELGPTVPGPIATDGYPVPMFAYLVYE